jgi:hypothetical protein
MSKRQSTTLKFRTNPAVFNTQKNSFNFRKPKFIFTICDITNMYFKYTGLTEKITKILKVRISEAIHSCNELKLFESFLEHQVSKCLQNQQHLSLNEIISLYLNTEQGNSTYYFTEQQDNNIQVA